MLETSKSIKDGSLVILYFNPSVIEFCVAKMGGSCKTRFGEYDMDDMIWKNFLEKVGLILYMQIN